METPREDSEPVLIRTAAAGVAWLRLNRPRVANAINGRLRLELLRALRSAVEDPAVKVIVISAEGRTFCSGTDTGELIPSSAHIDRVREPNVELLKLLRLGPKPVVAMMTGPAAGIGLSIALACDLRFATPDVFLYSAFGKLGLTADGGLTWLLARLAGLGRGLEMLYCERRIGAEEALSWGLLNGVVEPDAIHAHVAGMAAALAGRSGESLAAMKQSMNRAAFAGFEDAMNHEFDLQADLLDGDEFQSRYRRLHDPGRVGRDPAGEPDRHL